MNQRAFQNAISRVFMLNRVKLLAFNNGEMTPHSPLFRAKHGLDDRKSRMFDQKAEIPGRKPKYFLTLCLLAFFWSIYKFRFYHEQVRYFSY